MIAARASACWSIKAPGIVTGAMAPASVKGVITETWLAAAKSMIPLHIAMSSWRGEFVLMTV